MSSTLPLHLSPTQWRLISRRLQRPWPLAAVLVEWEHTRDMQPTIPPTCLAAEVARDSGWNADQLREIPCVAEVLDWYEADVAADTPEWDGDSE